ncbi:flagellar hook-length control protein FliK [Massilia consociata]|uniref:Flagellar hook-length control protein FliK n=1 Tax=Massilia consociata TaxID=760117 RepID=A0ABV6FAM7_9BURK
MNISMNSTMSGAMNGAPMPAAGDAATAATAATAAAMPAVAGALALDPALAAQAGVPGPLPFLQFMQDAPALPPDGASGLPDAATAAADEALPPDAGEPADDAVEPLAALAMPLMPAMMPALPAALPLAVRMAAGGAEPSRREAAPVPAAAAGAVELPPAVSLPAQATDAVGAQLARSGAAAAPPASTQAADAKPAPAMAAAQAGDAGAADSQPAPAPAGAGFGVAAPGAPGAPARDGATLTLSGPPSAWRQSLQDALGERLNLQLGKSAEQATIRLEPPMLGRVEISIRHAAGSLEVNITATHSEVLRQLNTVSDNLRNDLAARQFTDVSVNVSQAPRAQATAQAGAQFGADAQGRGSQQGQEQDERAPGAALLEAHHPNTAFSLNGRA